MYGETDLLLEVIIQPLYQGLEKNGLYTVGIDCGM